MHLTNLNLRSFRNFTDQSLAFGPSFNIIVGDNAQGKTNILEALSVCAHGRSFRTSEWRDMIKLGEEQAVIDARVETAGGTDGLRVVLAEPRKKFERNGKTTQPGGFSGMNVVLFAPEEIQLLRTQPGARRRFIDSFIASFAKAHRKCVRDYETVISQRNKLLSDEGLGVSARCSRLEAWDDQLISLGMRIILNRAEWVGRLNETLPDHYGAIARADGSAHMNYEPNVEASESTFRARLEARRSDEFVRGVTLVGPHRDDLVAHIGDGAVKRFASQGQHRSFVLALKIAEMEVHREVLGDLPLLLLDDVASELDPERNRRFFEYVQDAKGQVFITTTHRDDVKLEKKANMKSYMVEQGEVLEQRGPQLHGIASYPDDQ